MRRALDAKLTYDDYAAIPSDGLIYQIADGEVFVTPAPSPYHQRASKRLQRQLEAYFETSGRGEVFKAPIDLILSPHDITQPDLVVAPPDVITRRGIERPPLLVVEVLSPSTETFDRQVKARRFAALGVRTTGSSTPMRGASSVTATRPVLSSWRRQPKATPSRPERRPRRSVTVTPWHRNAGSTACRGSR